MTQARKFEREKLGNVPIVEMSILCTKYKNAIKTTNKNNKLVQLGPLVIFTNFSTDYQ